MAYRALPLLILSRLQRSTTPSLFSSSSPSSERAARGAGGRRAEVGLEGLRLDDPSLPPPVGVVDASAPAEGAATVADGDVTRSLGRLAARFGDGRVRLVLSPPLVARDGGDATTEAGLGVGTGSGEFLVPPREGARRLRGVGCGDVWRCWSSSSSSDPSLSSSSDEDGRAVERLALRELLAVPPVSYCPAGRLLLRAALAEDGCWNCLRVTRARALSTSSSSSDSSWSES